MKTVASIRRANLELLVQHHATLEAVATHADTSPVYLSQIRKQALDNKTGKPRQMGDGLARKLEVGCGKPLGWMDTDHDNQKFDRNVAFVKPGIREYPVISYIQAGALTEISSPYGPGDGFDVEVGDDDASPWAFFLEIRGDSMMPDFRPGDRVLIDPEVHPSAGDYVAARNSEQEATFKKYRVRGVASSGQEIFELVPLNDDFASVRSDEHHLRVIGTMIEHRRKFRRK